MTPGHVGCRPAHLSRREAELVAGVAVGGAEGQGHQGAKQQADDAGPHGGWGNRGKGGSDGDGDTTERMKRGLVTREMHGG